ncbi:Crp/Fnr family transcriptional regulator [Gilvimarinus algae]|uniref:Crp/Fnr family transcriptional regulator n=1 Tax=Gilvimarinus algae TaxID=3058037 RepID=A0ABT8TC56_9GAMM|nr:Crp/Fnr family transcriptional regulator [Gilvimarinus sp. SDUM040014]MDO3380963.1 Crp/Fnr family transcriptional regulator [Gilvimarinus sp. SDUM040014]
MTEPLKAHALAYFGRLAPLSDQALERVWSHFSGRRFASGETIFSQGEKPLSVHFVLQGVGRYFYLDTDGKERNKSLVGPGGAFASMSSHIFGEPSLYGAEAITPCETLTIDYDRLVGLSECYLEWNRIVRRLLEHLAVKKERREASLLLDNATQRYQRFVQDYGEIAEQIPLKHIAMYIGVTDVSLSRIRRELKMSQGNSSKAP